MPRDNNITLTKRKSGDISDNDALPPAKRKHHHHHHHHHQKQDNSDSDLDLDHDHGHNGRNDKSGHKHPTKRVIRHHPKGHKYPSVNELKRRIRDARRLLNKVDLSADARVLQERALAGYEKDLEDELKRRKRSEMIKRYHFVRFLERKTATKQLKRLLRREKDPENNDTTDLSQRIEAARIDLNYTIYYPLTEKYVSLYPDKKLRKITTQHKDADSGADANASASATRSSPSPSPSDAEPQGAGNGTRMEASSSTHAIHPNDNAAGAKETGGKPAMWDVVKLCTEKGQETLDLLRDGKLKVDQTSGNTNLVLVEDEVRKPSSSSSSSKVSKEKSDKSHGKAGVSVSGKDVKISEDGGHKNRAARRREEASMGKRRKIDSHDDDDGDSDGGFFE